MTPRTSILPESAENPENRETPGLPRNSSLYVHSAYSAFSAFSDRARRLRAALPPEAPADAAEIKRLIEAFERTAKDAATAKQLNRPIFELARAVQALKSVQAHRAPPKLFAGKNGSILNLWHDHARLHARSVGYDTVRAEWLHVYDHVKVPNDGNQLHGIVGPPDALPIPRWTTDQYEEKMTRLLITVCLRLQNKAGPDKPFFLSGRIAADYLGVNRDAARLRLNLLVSDGVLSIEEKHTATRATRYRYHGDPNARPPAPKEPSEHEDPPF